MYREHTHILKSIHLFECIQIGLVTLRDSPKTAERRQYVKKINVLNIKDAINYTHKKMY